MFCYKCGAKLPDGAKFCHKCGAKSVSESAQNVNNDNLSDNKTTITTERSSDKTSSSADMMSQWEEKYRNLAEKADQKSQAHTDNTLDENAAQAAGGASETPPQQQNPSGADQMSVHTETPPDKMSQWEEKYRNLAEKVDQKSQAHTDNMSDNSAKPIADKPTGAISRQQSAQVQSVKSGNTDIAKPSEREVAENMPLNSVIYNRIKDNKTLFPQITYVNIDKNNRPVITTTKSKYHISIYNGKLRVKQFINFPYSLPKYLTLCSLTGFGVYIASQLRLDGDISANLLLMVLMIVFAVGVLSLLLVLPLLHIERKQVTSFCNDVLGDMITQSSSPKSVRGGLIIVLAFLALVLLSPLIVVKVQDLLVSSRNQNISAETTYTAEVTSVTENTANDTVDTVNAVDNSGIMYTNIPIKDFFTKSSYEIISLMGTPSSTYRNNLYYDDISICGIGTKDCYISAKASSLYIGRKTLDKDYDEMSDMIGMPVRKEKSFDNFDIVTFAYGKYEIDAVYLLDLYNILQNDHISINYTGNDIYIDTRDIEYPIDYTDFIGTYLQIDGETIFEIFASDGYVTGHITWRGNEFYYDIDYESLSGNTLDAVSLDTGEHENIILVRAKDSEYGVDTIYLKRDMNTPYLRYE